MLFMVAVGSGTYWRNHRSKPLETGVRITAPELTKLEDDKWKISPLIISFDRSAAPLEKIGKTVDQGIQVSPEINGVWTWSNDHQLRFIPKSDWPAGQEYTVTLAKKGLVADHIRLALYEVKFSTAPFSATITQAELYQDPVAPDLKTVVGTVAFTHPVDVAEFEKHVSMLMGSEQGGISGEPKKYDFEVTYDKLKLNAYVHSEPITIPEKDTVMHIVVDPGARAAQGGSPSRHKGAQQVSIAGLYSRLEIDSTELSLVDNERDEPEQVLIMTTSAPVHEKEIQKSVSAYLLPLFHPDTKPEERKEPYNWNDPTSIGPEILKGSQ